MSRFRVWLPAAVCGLAVFVGVGSGSRLRAEEAPRRDAAKREQGEREARDREERGRKDREHEDRARMERERREHEQREHEQREHEQREHEARDRDRRDHDSAGREHHDGDQGHGRPLPRNHPHDGHVEARDAVNGELHDFARALRRLDQSYAFRGMQGCGACTAGSAFIDWRAKGVYGAHYSYGRPAPPMPLVFGHSGGWGGRYYGGDYGTYSGGYDDCGCGHGYGYGPRGCSACDLVHSSSRGPGYGPVHHHGSVTLGDYGHHDRDDNCSLLTRRICTGCGHVYPRDEQPRCKCQGGDHDHADHPPHPQQPLHLPHRESEPTPVDRDPAPPQRR